MEVTQNLQGDIFGNTQNLFTVTTNVAKRVPNHYRSVSNSASPSRDYQNPVRSRSNIHMNALPNFGGSQFDEGPKTNRPPQEIKWKPDLNQQKGKSSKANDQVNQQNRQNKFTQIQPSNQTSQPQNSQAFITQNGVNKPNDTIMPPNLQNLQFQIQDEKFVSTHNNLIGLKNKTKSDPNQSKMRNNKEFTWPLNEFTVTQYNSIYGEDVQLSKYLQLLPLYMDMYYNAMQMKLGERIVNHHFKMSDFIEFSDQQSDNAAPFKDIDSNDVAYLHMRTRAQENWSKLIEQRKSEELDKEILKYQKMSAQELPVKEAQKEEFKSKAQDFNAMIHKQMNSYSKIRNAKMMKSQQAKEQIDTLEAPKHQEFSKLDQMIRFYFDFYKSHILHINVIKKDYYDREMNGTQQPQIAQKINEFRVSSFYELADIISEGAASFLKYRNDDALSRYIERLWRYDYEQDFNKYKFVY